MLLQPVVTGINASTHRDLDQLIHLISEDSFEEYSYTGNRIDAISVYEDNTKTKKIRETAFSYTGNKVITIITKQYDESGLLVETETESLSYVGNKLINVDRVLT